MATLILVSPARWFTILGNIHYCGGTGLWRSCLVAESLVQLVGLVTTTTTMATTMATNDRTKSSTNYLLENGVFAPEAPFVALFLIPTYNYCIRCRMPMRKYTGHLPISTRLPSHGTAPQDFGGLRRACFCPSCCEAWAIFLPVQTKQSEGS